MKLSIVLSKKHIIFLVLIFLLALVLRFYKITEIPFGVHRDELINAYIGRFILLNGKDVYGNSWPLFYFNKFGDYPPILPMYVMGLSTFLFGVNEFAMRFPAAFLGSLVVFPIFAISNLIYKNTKVALISAFLIAILPWHIVLSRYSGEGVLAVTSFTFGLAFLLSGIIRKKTRLMYISFIFFVLTYFLYPSFRLLTPLVLLPVPFLVSTKKERTILLIFIGICFFITFAIVSTFWGRARFMQTSLFQDPGIANTAKVLSNDEGPNSVLLARIFHNKAVIVSHEFLNQYLTYFSTGFLFIYGGPPHEYVVPNQGLLYYTFFILFLGLFLFSRPTIRNNIYFYLLYIFLLTPIPSALTTDFTPHVHRALIMTVPIVILLPLGLLKIQQVLKEKNKLLPNAVTVALFCVIFLELIYFYHQYLQHTSSFKSTYKNDSSREAIQYVIAHKKEYDEIYIPFANLPFYYLFYSNDFSSKYIGKFHTKYGHVQIDQIDNIKFVRSDCPSELFKDKKTTQKILVLDGDSCKMPLNFGLIYDLRRKDSTEAFRFLSLKNE